MKYKKYSYQFIQKVVWGDQDAFGHVNHANLVKYFENARADFFTSNRLWNVEQKTVREGMVMVQLQMEYRNQVRYPNDVLVTLEITKVSYRKFQIDCTMWVDKDIVCICIAEFMWFHFELGKSTSLPIYFEEFIKNKS